jgi:hypothetical protein
MLTLGGKDSTIEEATSLISKTRRYLMFTKERILKDKNVSSGTDITEPTRDGELFILTNHLRSEVKDTTISSVSTS